MLTDKLFTKGILHTSLVLVWIISSIFLVIGLVTGRQELIIPGIITGYFYIAVFIWWLSIQKTPQLENTPLPDVKPPRIKSFNTMLAIIFVIMVILFTLTCLILQNGWHLNYLSVLLSLVIIVIYRKDIRFRYLVACGILLVILGLVEQMMGEEQSSGLIVPIMTSIMFLSGVLLLERSRLSQIRLLDGNYLQAGKSFLWGCAMAVPPALVNIVQVRQMQVSDFDQLFDSWWKSFYALQPGIVEEIWARLLLVTFIYSLLQPLSAGRPNKAAVWSIVLAAFIHGFAHFPLSISNPIEIVFVSVSYGIPLGLLFVKRDLERAVAYHFFIDLVRFFVVYMVRN